MDFDRGLDYYCQDVDPYWQPDFVSVITRNLSMNSQFCGGKVLTRDTDPLLGIDSSQQEEKSFKEEQDMSSYDAWRNKAVDEWTAKDVLSWLGSEAQYFGVLIHEVQGHNFAGINGSRLKQMTEEEFCALSPNFGYNLYDNLQSIIRMNMNKPYQIDQYFENSSDSGFETEIPVVSPVTKRRPGRPKGSRRKKKPEKLGRLWEFIRDLLLNSEYCPSLICWDNYEEGMFRFVHSDKVAKLWGSKKDNPEMNYEKLSRAMRYYYKSRVLLPVFGRRLVYKFGPTATGWRTPNPNFRRRG